MIEMIIIAGVVLAAYGVTGYIAVNVVLAASICIFLGLTGGVMYFLKKTSLKIEEIMQENKSTNYMMWKRALLTEGIIT